MIEWCRQNLPGQFTINQLEPPLAYRDDEFGLVYALSVFTHLPERLQVQWLRELGRVLRPGGLLVFSTLGAYYARFGRLTAPEQQAFDSGRPVVLFEEHAGENICSAYHPRMFVERSLTKDFEYLSYREGNAENPQDTHVIRKP